MDQQTEDILKRLKELEIQNTTMKLGFAISQGFIMSIITALIAIWIIVPDIYFDMRHTTIIIVSFFLGILLAFKILFRMSLKDLKW